MDAALDPSPGSALVGPALDKKGVRNEVERVIEVLGQQSPKMPGDIGIKACEIALSKPLGLAGHSRELTAGLLELQCVASDPEHKSDVRAAAEFICRCNGDDGAWLSPSQGSIPIANPQGAIFAMDFLLNDPRLKFAPALAQRPQPAEVVEFLGSLHQYPTLDADANNRWNEFGKLSRSGIDLSDEGIMRAIAASLAHIDAQLGITAVWSESQPEAPNDEIASAITGEILAAEMVAGIGWVVVGSCADNSYDMTRIAAVFDPAGSDSYRWVTMHTGNQAIIDLAGDDRYVGGPSQGPAGAILGLSLIDDRDGNDRYEGSLLSCGAGVFGVGVLIDRAGNDSYTTGDWSIGAGAFGAGFLFDHDGCDTYSSGAYSQGVGGPLGIGALVDLKGGDLYRVSSGPPSAYADPAVTYGMSQGVGCGIRHIAAGGVGVICDYVGDDRYESGEFSQACGYYFGLGMLLDGSGNDSYMAGRYSQGTAAHMGAGALIDLSGDDSYWAMVAASQGGTWDLATALLADVSGNDTYRAGGLSQGGAAQQAIAALCDLAGSDHYVGLADSVQGESGDNSYHFAEWKSRSFSVLIDKGDGTDYFSAWRPRNATKWTGPSQWIDALPTARLLGVSIDTP